MANQTYRIGGFAALNTGRIEDCYSQVHMRAQEGASGFCGENRGTICRCFSRGRIQENGKSPRSGLCSRQNGKIEDCFWVCGGKHQGSQYWKDWNLAVSKTELSQNQEALTQNWDRHVRWFVPRAEDESRDIALLDRRAEIPERTQVVEIGTVRELFDAAERINEGDSGADILFRLTADLNLGGKLWSPIGIDGNTPFSGCFDGGGHTVRNFRIKAKKSTYSGLFGYISPQGEIHNLHIDCVIEGRGNYTGAMAAFNNGTITNCTVRTNCGAARYAGCFTGQNSGVISGCCVMGRISPWLLLPWWLLPLVLTLVMSVPPAMLAFTTQLTPPAEVFAPIIVDPNARPISPDDEAVPEPDPEDLTDTSASFVMNAEMSVSRENYAGMIGLRCPSWSTKGFVATATVSAADLQKNGSPYTQDAQIYKSGLLMPNMGIDIIQLGSLPDGSKLPAGTYTFTVQFDFYDPETNERSSVNSTAPLDVVIH